MLMKITYQGLTISIPFDGVIQVEDFSFDAAFNCHGRVFLRLLAEEEKIQGSIHALQDGANVEVYENSQLFVGRILRAEMETVRGLYYLNLEACSYTMDWKRVPVSRSFLNLDATYEQVMQKVLEDQERAQIKDCLTNGRVIPDFLLQYEESDWDFLIRLASQFQSFLVPDCSADHGRAYFGIPPYEDDFNFSEEEYETIKDVEAYHKVNRDGELLPQEIIKWNVKTGHSFHLAQRGTFRGLRCMVTAIQYRVIAGELCRYYELSREQGVRSTRMKNGHINGMSIPATVKERSGNCVRVHFHIDPVYEAAPNQRYFTFAIESSFIYCMPEVGSQVHIYFPTDEEKDAVAVHAIRTSAPGKGGKGGTGGGYAQNPDYKSFSNVTGAHLLLAPKAARISAEESAVTSVCLDGEGNAYIQGKELQLQAEKGLSMGESASEEGGPAKSISVISKSISAKSGDSGMELSEETKILAAFVKLEAAEGPMPEGMASSSELIGQITANDAADRASVTNGVSSQLVEKYQEGKTKILSGVAKILTTVATVGVAVALTVATGGAGALVAGSMIATGVLGTANIAFAAADIAEGSQDVRSSQSGNLNESFNFIRDTAVEAVFGEHKQQVYNFLKAGTEIAFGVVAGAAIGNAGMIKTGGQLVCGSQKVKNLKAVVQIGGNVVNQALNDLAYTGKVDVKGLAFNTLLGLGQGYAGTAATGRIMNQLGLGGNNSFVAKGTQAVVGTLVDTGMDWGASSLAGREFDPWQSLAQNGFANSLTVSVSDPVDAVWGHYLVHATDFVLASLPEPVRLERSYRSGRHRDSAMGRGWLFAYDSRIYKDTNYSGQVHLDTVTGHSVCFKKQGEAWVNQSPGTERFSLYKEEGRFILGDAVSHTRCIYGEKGRLEQIRYPNQLQMGLYYDEEGLCRMVTPLGNKLEIVSRHGRILEITDEIGRKTQYRYEGDLLTDVIHTDEGVTHYAYDKGGYITSETNQNGIRYLENEYDAKGRILRQTFESGACQTFRYDDRKCQNTVTYSENGKTERYEYGAAMLPERITYEDGTSTVYRYSEQNLLISQTSRTGAQTRWEYDSLGRRIKETDPEGLTTHYAYDHRGDLIRTWDTDGRETCTEYDSGHNPVRIRERISGSQWRERAYRYDGLGRRISETDGNGNETVFQYEEKGAHPSRVITPKGEETRYEYDRAGRRLSIQNACGTVQLGYNSRNFVTRRTDGEGNTSRWFYDRMGNMTAYYPARRWNRNEPGYEYRYDFLERVVDTISPEQEHQRVFRNFEGGITRRIHPEGYAEKGSLGEGTRYEYDKDGNAIRIYYADGGVERRFYDADGHMLRQILPEHYDQQADQGPGYTYAYDRMGRLTRVTDPDGKLLRQYAYNGHAQVLREADGEGKETLFAYDSLGQKVEERTSIRREKGATYYRVKAYRYDLQGNKTEELYGETEAAEGESPSQWQRIRFTYDTNNRLIRVEDDFGAKVQYDYDCLGNRTLEEQTIEEGVKRTIRFRYNKNGWRVQKTEEIQGNGGIGLAVTSYGYDENGNLTSITTPKGHRIQRSYDKDDRLVSERIRDKANGIDRTVRYAYDAAGNLVQETVEGADGTILTSSCQYDRKDRLTRRAAPSGASRSYVYDQNDNLIKELQAYGENEREGFATVTAYEYDSRGNRIRQVNGLGQTVQEWGYDLQDNVIRQKDGLGNETEISYTLDGRARALRQGEKGKAIQSCRYDARGRVLGITDGNSQTVTYDTDAWGRITGIGFADGVRETYAYTSAGQIKTSTDGKGNLVQYRYNSLGKVRERRDQLGGTEQFQYDAEGNLALYIDRDGKQVHRSYNALGNLVYERAVDEKGEHPCIRTYRYDSIGRLMQAVSDGHSYEYQYDEKGRLKEKRSSGKRLVSYEYDPAGRIRSMTDPAGVTTRYEYDLLGRMNRIHSKEGMEVGYEYDCLDRITQLAYGNGVETEYRYDGSGNIEKLETKRGERILLSFCYTYDGNGNRIHKKGRQCLPDGTEREIDISYGYNLRNQLAEETRNGAATKYSYDAAGNRLSKEDAKGRTNYHYNEKNQLVSLEENGTKKQFTYSRQGSILTEEGAEGTRRYVYNSRNQQIRVEWKRGIQENRYDAEGLRYETEENGQRFRFVYHNGELLYEGGDREETSYHTGAGIEGFKRNGERFYYHQDEQLSEALITDTGGRIQNHYQYDAFGAELNAMERIPNRIRYTGQQYDQATEQYYLRARYYNPILGRFLQEDEYLGDGLNLYAYCENNPVMYYDPSGYSSYEAKVGSGIGDEGGSKSGSKTDVTTGLGYDAGDTPVRIDGDWTENDMKQALLGHPPRGLGSPDIHHGGQMPGGALHEVLPGQHRNNPALHPNTYNQGVTPEMRMEDRQLHWWYRAREQGADELLPDWIYD